MTFDDITLRVRTQGGFDSSTSNLSVGDIQAWIQERYRQMVGLARWRMAEVQIATAVAGQYLYALSADTVDVEGLNVDGVTYDPVGTKQLWDLRNGTKQLSARGTGGVFGIEFLADGTVELSLFPTPTTSGGAITGLVALAPVALTSGDTPAIPADLHEYLVWGAIATGLATIEERLDSAGYFEQQFAKGVDLLTKRKNSRVAAGPRQIAIAGYHF